MFHARYKLSERTDVAKFWILHDSVQKIDWLLHLGVFTGVPESQTSEFERWQPTWEIHHSARQLSIARNEESCEQDRCICTRHQINNSY